MKKLTLAEAKEVLSTTTLKQIIGTDKRGDCFCAMGVIKEEFRRRYPDYCEWAGDSLVKTEDCTPLFLGDVLDVPKATDIIYMNDTKGLTFKQIAERL